MSNEYNIDKRKIKDIRYACKLQGRQLSKSQRDIIPVDIQRALYDRVSKSAAKRDTSIRKFVNDLLNAALNKYEFLEKALPELQLDGIGEKSLYLKDLSTKDEKTAEVRIYERYRLQCLLCKTNNCKHVHFAETIPDIGHIILLQRKDKVENSGSEAVEKSP